MVQHHALQISEIVRLICEHLVPSINYGHPWRSDLASMASCCKTFAEPAIDSLWKDMLDIEPLLALIPAICRRSVGIEGNLNTYFVCVSLCVVHSLSDEVLL
ncbi:hypothetical protein JAAARDRAFT_664593 [Jaapia argillacea MUCL 33604]|uniref:F-box domain-containing protein n=1 Tax=Jaapia argillacea MUCL 33604 TaxID=933084 RepID=A0A067PU34_9AGAM|nr:hypothetical protein JAAARDRAFT_664593 [Jaapia argillacea MUCL 33604]